MHGDLFANDEAIRHEFADCLTRVGIGDFVDFVRVKPDLALPTTHNRGSEPLLSTKINPRDLKAPLAILEMARTSKDDDHSVKSGFTVPLGKREDTND